MDGAEREERTQRIRIGLTGLAFVFLLVLLGTAISRAGEDRAPPLTNENAALDEPNEPLAEIGAAPGAGASNDADGADGQSNRQ